MNWRITDLTAGDTGLVDEIAEFLVECFRAYASEWIPDKATGLMKIKESFSVGRRSRVLTNDEGIALGWAGAIVGKNMWEIHPIAVSPAYQRKGYGSLLIDDIVGLARTNGAAGVWAGTGDTTGSTSFSTVDLYRDAASAMMDVKAPEDHPVHFWSRMGFSLVGVLPDEEGLGRPGIHFAKRIASERT